MAQDSSSNEVVQWPMLSSVADVVAGRGAVAVHVAGAHVARAAPSSASDLGLHDRRARRRATPARRRPPSSRGERSSRAGCAHAARRAGACRWRGCPSPAAGGRRSPCRHAPALLHRIGREQRRSDNQPPVATAGHGWPGLVVEERGLDPADVAIGSARARRGDWCSAARLLASRRRASSDDHAHLPVSARPAPRAPQGLAALRGPSRGGRSSVGVRPANPPCRELFMKVQGLLCRLIDPRRPAPRQSVRRRTVTAGGAASGIAGGAPLHGSCCGNPPDAAAGCLAWMRARQSRLSSPPSPSQRTSTPGPCPARAVLVRSSSALLRHPAALVGDAMRTTGVALPAGGQAVAGRQLGGGSDAAASSAAVATRPVRPGRCEGVHAWLLA
jgi:hypothetical protein